MARRGSVRRSRSPKSSRNPPKRKGLWKKVWSGFFFGCVGVFAWVWFHQQPEERQVELVRLARNYWSERGGIAWTEVISDVWRYYSTDAFVNSVVRGGDDLVFGGIPRVEELEKGAGGVVRVLSNRGYWVGFSMDKKLPLWVGYRLFDPPTDEEVEERPREFSSDSRISDVVLSEDYARSGFDRGHMAPNFGIARCYGRKAQEETFLMSNVVPQYPMLNGGVWRELERRVALNYTARFGAVWVLTGPVFNRFPHRTLSSGVWIPDGFFKIVIEEGVRGLRVMGFVIPQEATGEIEDYLTSVDEIERLTGIDFLWKLEESVEEILEGKVERNAW